MSLMILLALTACKPALPEPEPSPLLDLPEDAAWTIEGLHARGYLVTTEAGIPHVYATNRDDGAAILGFAVARDRFFLLDMVRRMATGRISALFGDLGLEADMESRGIAMTRVTDIVEASLTPEQRTYAEAYASGINAYIEAVRVGRALPPSEYETFHVLLGHPEAVDAMEPFTVRDVAAMIGTVVFRLGFDTSDANRTADLLALQALAPAADLAELREAGIWADHWTRVDPPNLVASADGWGESGTRPRSANPHRPSVPVVEATMLEAAIARGDRIQDRFGRDHESGWGSNAWVVAGSHSADGRALLAGDGHLELDIPSLMYQAHVDTQHLSGESGQGYNSYGDLIVGVPLIATGTNGRVAWGFTQLFGDVTDVYADQIRLDEQGRPKSSLYQGEWLPLVEHPETYTIAEVAALGSNGRTETWSRWETHDGRWLYSIEGRPASPSAQVEAGEAVINTAGAWVIPADVDGDGVITALTLDYTAVDGGSLLSLLWDWAHAQDVVDVAEATRKAQALSLNTVAADTQGDIFYTGYQMTPCRKQLERNSDGTWADGSDPTLVIDGTRFRGFEVPLTPELTADESFVDDPIRCVVPWDEYPHSFTPEKGYLLTANNDPGGITFDNDLSQEPWYMAGPWMEGFRADAIDRNLAAYTADHTADIAAMSAVQGFHQSTVGRQFAPFVIGALERARALHTAGDAAPDSADARLAELYGARAAQLDEVISRLQGWADRGFEAASGVETFYHPTVDATEHEDAVATMLWNTIQGDVFRDAIGDEGLAGMQPTGDTGRTRLLKLMLVNRGQNPNGLASWNPDTEESAFWDDRTTPGLIETSDEIMVRATTRALDFLASAPGPEATGGFGTEDMNAWVWGLRHQVEFRSLLASFIDDPMLTPILEGFAITTDRLPLADSLPSGDPRKDLQWFPRPGDNLGVDACNNGSSGRWFRCGSGPVMRQVFALGPNGVEGVDVIPGGQSGLNTSAHFDDQAALWLGNEALPMRYTVEDVIAHAQKRETFAP